MNNAIKINSDFLVVLIHSIINSIFIVLGVFMTDIVIIPSYLSSIMGIYTGISIITLPLFIIYFST